MSAADETSQRGWLDGMDTLGDVLRGNAGRRPDKIAFERPGGDGVTFSQFNRRVNRLAHAIAGLGIAPGSRVAILAKNAVEYVEVYGLGKAGIIVMPLNWRLSRRELSRLMVHGDPAVLVADACHLPLVDALRADLGGVKHFVAIGTTRRGWLSYEALIAQGSEDEPDHRADGGDTLCLIHTSGTTGLPKAVAITHGAALGNARVAASEALALTETDRVCAVMPLFHVGGMWYHLFPSFATGCSTLILPEFEAGAVLRSIEAGRITNIHLVPTMIGSLLAHPEAATADLSSLRTLFYAASPIPAELLRRAMAAFPSCGFSQSYGSTEAGAVTVLDPRTHVRAAAQGGAGILASCGRPMSGRSVRIVDDDRHPLPTGAVGEIEVRSPDAMRGYWREGAVIDAVGRDGWLPTGDIGFRDEEGLLTVIDRKNDMVVTGGENVYPSEVEAQLHELPEVREAAVFGVPDPNWIERVVAAVVLHPGSRIGVDELGAHLRTRLAAYKCPKEIIVLDALPRGAAGKVSRKALRSIYGGSVPSNGTTGRA